VAERLSERDPAGTGDLRLPHTVSGRPPLKADEAGGVGGDRIAELKRELRSLMWEHVGIVRSDSLLEEAEHAVTARRSEWEAAWARTACSPDGVELRNLLQTADLIVRCARLRAESRGLHYNVDHPWRDSERYLRDTVIDPWEDRVKVRGGGGAGSSAPLAAVAEYETRAKRYWKLEVIEVEWRAAAALAGPRHGRRAGRPLAPCTRPRRGSGAHAPGRGDEPPEPRATWDPRSAWIWRRRFRGGRPPGYAYSKGQAAPGAPLHAPARAGETVARRAALPRRDAPR
jgi:hypothetical protein